MPDAIQYPYLPAGRSFKFVPREHPFMQAADQARNEKAGDRINPVGIALVKDGKVLVTAGNGHNLGYGHVHVCPRVVLECKTGEGYDLCTFHEADGHAEPSAVAEAKKQGIDIKGCDAYMSGHWWACEPCWKVLTDAGLNDFYLVENAHEVFDKKNVQKETLVPSVKNIYLSCALTNAPASARVLYSALKEAASGVGVNMYCPHEHTDPMNATAHSPKEVYEVDKKRVQESDAMIAVVTLPSLGVGVELEWAVSSGKPIVLMSEKGSKVSRAILGLPGVVYHIEFEGIEDAQRKLQQVLKQL
ncbi:MAG: hypothetical protein UY95_C0033G0004 [Parcubacteria group bacterium GW2011_GWA2_56_7]|nr:MAG: hypothetical protein UY95_C0033G0004 [Parcubacteria group bacterium GW2011_GWA2_56_7]